MLAIGPVGRMLQLLMPLLSNQRELIDWFANYELYRRQIAQGLDGDERAALKTRVFLRELLARINLQPEGSELWAEYGVAPTALLKVVGCSGSGGLISLLATRVRLSLAAR
jgi:hypothetical protein